MPLLRAARLELAHFRERLNPAARRLLASNAFQAFSNPLAWTFLNAFIWRETGSFLGVAAYSAGQFAASPLAFWLNGHALRRIRVRAMFALGATLSGLAAAGAVAFPARTAEGLFLLGALWGMGNGFYWSNRNYLEFQGTSEAERPYFYGIVSSLGKAAEMAMPPLAGWFIVAGPALGLPRQAAYWGVFGLSLALMLSAAVALWRGRPVSPVPEAVCRFGKKSAGSLSRRFLQAAKGAAAGASFVGPVATLAFLGDEGTLGMLSAATSALALAGSYAYGRLSKPQNRGRHLASSAAMGAAGALALALLPRVPGALAFSALWGPSCMFFSLAADPLLLARSDAEGGAHGRLRYSFIFDNELFLNVGRLLGVALAALPAALGNQGASLTYGALLACGLQASALAGYLYKRESPVPTGRPPLPAGVE